MDVPVTHDLANDLVWPRDGVTRVPFRVFSDPAIYAEEQKRLFRGPIWNRERYDWSDPNVIVFTAVDSGFVKPGKRVVMRIEPASGGGSRVLATWEGSGSGAFGTVFVGVMALTRGFFIRRSIQSGLDRIAREAGGRATNL